MRILITGASGFVGTRTCEFLNSIGHKVIAFSRNNKNLPKEYCLINGGSLSNTFSNYHLLNEVQCVIHLAGKTNFSNNSKEKNELEFFNTNVYETIEFAKHCSKSNVKRFIFVSSIKVNGEFTRGLSRFNENDLPNPQGFYALSKYEAELKLLNLASNSNMEIVIVRPPIIYGPNAKGYFGNLLNLINKGIPIPFGSILDNRRSLIFIDNFLDLISTLVHHPRAANEIFLCSDQYDLSTADLVNRLLLAMNKKNNNFKIPKIFLKSFLYLLGKHHIYKKISTSLRINSSKANSLLGWNPPKDISFAINKVAEEYHSKKYKNFYKF